MTLLTLLKWNQFSSVHLNCSLQIICLSPTFDLAKQNGDVLTRMGKYCPDIKVVYAIRGERGMLLYVWVWLCIILVEF